MARILACYCFCLTLVSTVVFGQSADTRPTFEAADVHASAKSRNAFMQGPFVRNGRYEVKQANMVDLISQAYGIDGDDILGGPIWLEMQRFDVIAKGPAKSKPEVQKAMLQALLADRFKLVIHNDTKPLPAFALTAGKHPQLKKAEEGTDTGSGCKYAAEGADGAPAGPSNPPTMFAATCRNMTIKAFADGMRNMPFADRYLNRSAVVDQTSLEGAWDIVLKYSFPPRPGLEAGGTVTLADAVEKQLGLKLDAIKIPLPVVMVDSVNQTPTANPPGIAAVLGNTRAVPEFEVAVIKPTAPDVQGMRFNIRPGGRLDIQGVNLKFLIEQMWQITPEMLVDAPKWLEEDRYDITAKAPEVVSTEGGNGQQIDFETVLLMVQNLLKDRFKLATHMEDRPLSAYNLVASKPKLKKAEPTSRTRFKEGPATADAKNDPRNKVPALSRLVTVQNMTMAQFAEQLQNIAPGYIHSPVLDATGLAGSFDFTLSFSPAGAVRGAGGAGGGGGGRGGGGGDAAPPSADSAADPTGAISLPEAIEKQLGLKLEQLKRPVSVLVIDHVERKPTEN